MKEQQSSQHIPRHKMPSLAGSQRPHSWRSKPDSVRAVTRGGGDSTRQRKAKLGNQDNAYAAQGEGAEYSNGELTQSLGVEGKSDGPYAQLNSAEQSFKKSDDNLVSSSRLNAMCATQVNSYQTLTNQQSRRRKLPQFGISLAKTDKFLSPKHAGPETMQFTVISPQKERENLNLSDQSESSTEQHQKMSQGLDCADHISQSGSTAEVIALAAKPGLSLQRARKSSSAARDRQASSRAQVNQLSGSHTKPN